LDEEHVAPAGTGLHPCYFRGCSESVPVGKYHCDRHQAILEKQRAAVGRRNSERAAERRASKSRRELEQRLDAELADEGGLADWLRAEIRSGEWERRQRRNYQNILRARARLAQLKREGYTFDSERRLVAH
jgi:hypothetical protein